MSIFRKEPAVILGALATIITAVVQAIPANGHLTWSAIVPILAAAIIRQFVTPANSAATPATVTPGVES